MAYTKTIWKDRVVEFPNRYKDQNGVSYTLSGDFGIITEVGTPIVASNMNAMEDVIFDVDAYITEFDDENNLLKYNRDVTVVDANYNPTEIQYKRPSDSTLFLKRNYSNADSNGFYQTVVEQFYQTDGTTVYKTITYTLTYLNSGIIDTSTRVVS